MTIPETAARTTDPVSGPNLLITRRMYPPDPPPGSDLDRAAYAKACPAAGPVRGRNRLPRTNDARAGRTRLGARGEQERGRDAAALWPGQDKRWTEWSASCGRTTSEEIVSSRPSPTYGVSVVKASALPPKSSSPQLTAACRTSQGHHPLRPEPCPPRTSPQHAAGPPYRTLPGCHVVHGVGECMGHPVAGDVRCPRTGGSVG